MGRQDCRIGLYNIADDRTVLNNLCAVESFTSLFGQIHFQFKGCLDCFAVLAFIREIPALNANSVDADQTPHSAASDLGQHCLPMALFKGR